MVDGEGFDRAAVVGQKGLFWPCPVPPLHVDTSYKIPAMIEYRDRVAREWGLKLVVGQNKEALAAGMNHTLGRVNCCTALKTNGLKQLIEQKGYTGIILGVRADEEGTRAKERYFSPRDKHGDWDFRDQPPELWDQFKTTFPPGTHIRIHPLLDWTEINIWEYIKLENIPFMDLYLDKGDGTRYRSLGCAPCTTPIKSTAKSVDDIIEELRHTTVAERSGRAQDEGRGMELLQKRRVHVMRMMKKTPNFVLGSSKSSTYPRGYASGFDSPRASLDGLFDHPR